MRQPGTDKLVVSCDTSQRKKK